MMRRSGGRKALMNPCWETLFIFTGKGYAHQRVSPVNGIQIVKYFSVGCFVLNEENECLRWLICSFAILAKA